GGSGRLYRPNSDGTIFVDTAGRKITNWEFGVYAGVEKKVLEDKLTVNATVRFDKNVNFDGLLSPALTFVFNPRKDHYIRASVSSALRNPTLTDQYLNLNVGPAILRGNLDGVEGLVTVESFNIYRSTRKKTDL